jgi:BTB/POZ domain
MDSSVVTVNVGGTHFTTTCKTLMQEPSSKLALIVRGILPSATDDGGHTFIDRDARFFQCILNFLRDGWTLLPSSPSERRELMQEARFFQVRSCIRSTCLQAVYRRCPQPSLLSSREHAHESHRCQRDAVWWVLSASQA